MFEFIVYRNCFTNAVSGGDTHCVDLTTWIHQQHPKDRIYLVHPVGDGQDLVYKDTQFVHNVIYKPFFKTNSFALDFLQRALASTLLVRTPSRQGMNQIFIASSHFIPDVIPIVLKTLFYKKVIRATFIHHVIHEMKRPNNLNTFLARVQENTTLFLIKHFFHKIIVVNPTTKNWLLAHGFNESCILMSSNPIHTEYSSYKKKLDKKDIELVYCGRLVPQKGVSDFVNIVHELYTQLPSIKAAIVGTGPERDAIDLLIKKYHLPITLHGYVSESEKFSILSRSQYLLFPSREEGWGMVIAESLSVGTPVLALRLPVYDWVFGKNVTQAQTVAELSKITYDTISTNKPTDYVLKQEQIIAFASKFSLENVCAAEYFFLTNN
jgi:glycosyltransferase involved in cell wall biosynthesis